MRYQHARDFMPQAQGSACAVSLQFAAPHDVCMEFAHFSKLAAALSYPIAGCLLQSTSAC